MKIFFPKTLCTELAAVNEYLSKMEEECIAKPETQNDNGGDVGFVTRGPNSVNVGSRSSLMEDDKQNKLFNVLQKEISFDVALSNMPCGTNAAIYFSEMGKTGNMGEANKAGAPYGIGYCDG